MKMSHFWPKSKAIALVVCPKMMNVCVGNRGVIRVLCLLWINEFRQVSISNTKVGKKTSISVCRPVSGSYSSRIKKIVTKRLKKNSPGGRLQSV